MRYWSEEVLDLPEAAPLTMPSLILDRYTERIGGHAPAEICQSTNQPIHTENLSIPIDMHPPPAAPLIARDLGPLTPGLMYIERLPSLVLIARAFFLLECGHTDRQTHKVTGATDYHRRRG